MLVSVLVVSLTTFLTIIVALYAYGQSNLQEIKDNWVKYRCNPIYMPLAGLVGGDVGTNFMNCTLQSVNTYAGFVMDPIYSNFNILTHTINTILDSMNSIRSAVVGASEGFLGIIKSTYGKIQNSMSSTAQIVGRIRTIMSRMITTFAVLMNIVNTGIQTGQSVANGPIGKAAEFLCFSPHTRIQTTLGILPMYCLEPGIKLVDGQHIRSVIVVDGTYTKMYRLGNICVSGNHKVFHDNKWIRVEDHPDAELTNSSKLLYCLNTDKHTIPIGNYLFKDYEETDDPRILKTFFEYVQAQYGNTQNPEKIANPLKYRYTGIRPYTMVLDSEGKEIRADSIKIHDELYGGNKVFGIVKHRISGFVEYEGIRVSNGTWVLEPNNGLKAIISQEPEEYSTSFLFYQFLTEHGYFIVSSKGKQICILDDQETTDEEIHTWRDNEIQKEEV
jgi:hypothetical protein